MELNNIFKPGGLLNKHFSKYEFRAEQLKMAQAVENSIKNNTPLAVEGATGVGKSFGYLIPIINMGERATISTSNKTLQDQLNLKDLPTLKKIFPELTWTVLKGKNNYFCPQNFNANRDDLEALLSKEQIRQIKEWASETEDGDVEFCPIELDGKVKELITCNQHTEHDKNAFDYLACFANRARARAKESDILLTNHTLLTLDVSVKLQSGGYASILPNTPILVIDEAHSLSDFAELAFSDDLNVFSLRRVLGRRAIKMTVPTEYIKKLQSEFVNILRENYLPAQVNQYYFDKLVLKSCPALEPILHKLEDLKDKVKANNDLNIAESLVLQKSQSIKELDNLIERFKSFIYKEGDSNYARWAEATHSKYGPTVTLKSAPLDVSGFLRKGLFNERITICTSATLVSNNSFNFFKYRTGLPQETTEVEAASPFDYKNNALVYFTNAEDDEFWQVEELIKASEGRALVLFTSYKDMNDYYNRVDIPYPKFIQSFKVTRNKLLEDFKSTPNAVLFATKSFWEGIDIQGEQLSLVIIHKIPFSSPADIVHKAKQEKMKEKYGKSAFFHYDVPEACLTLKQGVGRLIRSKTDRGVIALLDARITYAKYASAIVTAFPKESMRTQRLDLVRKFYKGEL